MVAWPPEEATDVTTATPQPVEVFLVPLSAAHLGHLARVIEDPDVLRWTRVPVPPPPDFSKLWLERYEAGRRDGTREGFVMVDAPGEFLGLAFAPKIDRETRTVELGYIVAPAARGRGVAVAALRKLTRWAFDELGALRAELVISHDNEASKAVARRCGYTCEGLLRSLYFKQGLREDTEIWSRLPTDP